MIKGRQGNAMNVMDDLRIPLNRDDPTPLYRQIASWFVAAITRGELPPYQRLPAIRALARRLGVSQVTITQTYDMLAAEGYVASHVGRGTFVAPIANTPATPAQLAPTGAEAPVVVRDQPQGDWIQTWQSLRPPQPMTLRQQWRVYLREIMRRLEAADTPISLSDGLPDASLFPLQRWRESMRLGAESLAQERVDQDRAPFQYGSALGDSILRNYLARAMERYGVHAAPDEILLTSGAQQGLDVIARTFLAPGDPLIVEELTYAGALELFELYGVTWQTVPLDQRGMRVDALAQRLGPAQPLPRLVYTIPTGHSPTGVNLSDDRRQQLIALASERNLLLIADMPFEEFCLDDDMPPPALASYDHDGRVISVMNFNKTVFPALRMGALIASRPVIELLTRTKDAIDRATSLPLARALWRHMDSPVYQRELRQFRRRYREARDQLLAILERDWRPLGCQWTYPQAGFSLMAQLPTTLDATNIALAAAAQGVFVLPGQRFSPVASGAWANSLRLSYGSLPPDTLDEAMRRLTAIVRQASQAGARMEGQIIRFPPQL